VGFPPGGIFDFMSRATAQKLQERWGQPAIVENKAGAGGLLAIRALQAAPPDGYTIMANGQITVMMPLFNKEASFKPGTDVQPIMGAFYAPYVMITNTLTPVKSLPEFMAYARANPGKLNWGVAPNTGQHIDTYGFIKSNGLDIAIVPYAGGAALLRALISNETQAYLGAAFGLDAQVKAGKITILGVTSANRFPLLPDVPTIKEQIGFDMDSVVEYGFFTTQGTPRPVVDKLAREIADIMTKTDVGAQIEKQGYAVRVRNTEEFTAGLTREYNRGKTIVDAAGIKPQ
jgi:tripartite-type tricarboxylate transporter receptor subunit TctC